MVDDQLVVVCMEQHQIVSTSACFHQSNCSETDHLKKESGKQSSLSSAKTECRICQEEDEEKNMDAPCACNGSLKFAHKNCIQRWCNKKGDITCEICYQVFSPNYTCPPPRSNTDVMAIGIRQAWRPQIDLDHHVLDFAAADQFLQSEYYNVANTGPATCFRSIAIILMLLLMMRQILMIIRDTGLLQESSVFFHYQIPILQLAGFLLPCYVVARSWYIEQHRRRRQV